MTETDLANLYNSQLNAGFNDAQIRAAANSIYGTQGDTDWNYLTNLASSLNTVSAPVITSAPVVTSAPIVTSAPVTTSRVITTAAPVTTTPIVTSSTEGASSGISDAEADRLVRAGYATIGRTGIGGATNQIDEAGYNNFVNLLKSGAISPADYAATFQGAVDRYITNNPNDPYTKYVQEYLGLPTTTLAPTTTAVGIATLTTTPAPTTTAAPSVITLIS